MPIYEVSAPNGKTYHIEGPAGASLEQVQAQIMRLDPSAGQRRKTIADRVAPESQGIIPTIESKISKGLSAGADRYIAAGLYAPVAAGIDRLRGKHGTVGSEFHRFVARDEAQEAANYAAHPKAATAAEIAGGVSSPLNRVGAGIKGTNALARLARFATPAATYGAISGATQTHGGLLARAEGAAEGVGASILGAVTGHGIGRIAGKLAPNLTGSARALTNWVTGHVAKGAQVEKEAMARILQRVQADAHGMGPTAQDIMDMRQAMPKGKPLSIMDVGGENLRAYAGRISRSPGEGRNAITKFLTDRSKGVSERLQADVAEHIHSGNAYESQQALIAARKAAAAPLYEKAYQYGGASQFYDEVKNLMARPSMRSALGKARRIAAEEGRNPDALGLQFGKDGLLVRTKKPSWQTYDYIKRGLDDVLEGYRDKTTGKMHLDTAGRAMEQTRTEFRNAMRRINPDYGKALDSFSGPSAAMDAIRRGQGFSNMRVEAIRDLVKDMPESEREFFKLGVADALQQKIASTGKLGGNVNVKNALLGKLRPAFKTQAEYAQFVNSVEAEYRMLETHRAVIGNSATARRSAEDESSQDMIDAARVGLHAAHGNVLGALARAGEALSRRAQTAHGRAVDAAAARLLTSPANRNALQLLASKPAPVRNHLARILAASGAYAGAKLPVAVNQGDQ